LFLTLSVYAGGKQEDSGSGEVDLTGKTIEMKILSFGGCFLGTPDMNFLDAEIETAGSKKL